MNNLVNLFKAIALVVQPRGPHFRELFVLVDTILGFLVEFLMGLLAFFLDESAKILNLRVCLRGWAETIIQSLKTELGWEFWIMEYLGASFCDLLANVLQILPEGFKLVFLLTEQPFECCHSFTNDGCCFADNVSITILDLDSESLFGKRSTHVLGGFDSMGDLSAQCIRSESGLIKFLNEVFLLRTSENALASSDARLLLLLGDDDIGCDVFLFFLALVCFRAAIMVFVNGRRSVTATREDWSERLDGCRSGTSHM
ncbi:hypothetical protein KCU93_g26, partial [Aureobasidium melanogenum]